MKFSICMATYNGSSYLKPQINSILSQMRDGDELVILDDVSQDDTLSVLQSFSGPNVRIYRNTKNLGHVQTFSKALSLATQPFIIMADQDDIWVDGRLDKMRNALSRPDVWLVSTNFSCIDSDGKSIVFTHPSLDASDSKKYFSNIVKILTGRVGYYGSAMAFKKELSYLVLPIPVYVEVHDHWISIAANLLGKNLHLNDKTLYRRIHGNNLSMVKRPLLRRFWGRVLSLISLFHLIFRSFRTSYDFPIRIC